MAYQVLALRYRPKTFDEVVGQPVVIQTLKNSLAHGRIGHAYLFSGVRGVGKTTVARLLAKALNCEKGPTVEPCNACAPCTEIAAGASLDVLEIDGASNNSVDDVRELRETVRYAPSRDRYRVFIIDEVHMLSNSAFNALLKTLEEPPPHAIFIFATTEYRKIPVTILSRCQHFNFKRISQGEIAAHLGRICAAEAVEISPFALGLIARMADGSLRDGQSTLDQVIAYSGSPVKDEDVRAILGVLDRDLLLGFVEKVSERDAAGLISLVDQVLETGHDPTLFLSSLMERVRDLLLMKIVPDPQKTLGLSGDDVAAMTGLQDRFSEEDLLRIIDAISREESRIRYSPQPRYLLEALAVRLCHLTHLEPLEEILARLPGVESGELPEAPAKKPRTEAPPQETHRRAEAPVAASTPSSETPALEAPLADSPLPLPGPIRGEEAADVQRQVEAILEKIHTERSALWGFLSHASFFDLTDGAFVISLPEDKTLFRTSIERKEYLAVIRSVVEAVTNRKVEVQVRIVAPLPSDAPLPAPERQETDDRKKKLLEEAAKSPVVQSFLDLFQGEITEIEEA
jgi:DNA polymerase III subunit gamma/tau